MTPHALLSRLFPVRRSLTGDGVRETIRVFQERIPLEIHEIPTGTDLGGGWVIPKEWRLNRATLTAPSGEVIADTEVNPLHLVGYSVPFKGWYDLEDLLRENRIHTIPGSRDAIPYVTSYYSKTWGFCLPSRVVEKLPAGQYHVNIDTEHFDGSMTMADLVIPGETEEEIVFWTYLDHPNMACNELSGPVVLTFLTEWLMSQKRRHTYRVVFGIETIGAIAYIREHFDRLKRRAKAVIVLTCLGATDEFWIQMPRVSVNYATRILEQAIASRGHVPKGLDWRLRGSDERQFGAPGVDLPVGTLRACDDEMYPEYHTSLDNLDLCTNERLEEAIAVCKAAVEAAEADGVFQATGRCEPMMSRLQLYPTTSKRGSTEEVRKLMTTLSYADGETSVLDIAERTGRTVPEVRAEMDVLESNGLVRRIDG